MKLMENNFNFFENFDGKFFYRSVRVVTIVFAITFILIIILLAYLFVYENNYVMNLIHELNS